MKKKTPPPAVGIGQRLARLRERRAAIVALSPEEKTDAILSFDPPAALVRSFAEQDFLLLIEEIGPDDALELIALASDRQWEHLVDARIWSDDRIDLAETTRWIDRLFRSDAMRTVRWLAREKPEFFELYLFRNIHIIVREPELEAAAIPDGYFSFDDTFYMEIPELPPRIVGNAADAKIRQDLIRNLLSRMADDDHIGLQWLLLETIRVLPAEAEEEEYRLRNVRMAEKGFLPFEEAVGIYQPEDAERLGQSPAKPPVKAPGDGGDLPVPLYPSGEIPESSSFSRALAAIADPETRAGLRTELAALCNRLIVADRQSIRSAEDLAAAVQKACGYLHLGLKALCKEEKAAGPAAEAALMQRFNLERIFRVGYGRVIRLKRRAENWRKQSWFQRAGLSLTFWDEAWTGVLGGLFLKRPLFFDNYRSGAMLYREFSRTEDLQETEATLAKIEAVDAVLARLTPDLERLQGSAVPPTWKNLLLTCWLRSVVGLDTEPEPVSPNVFRQAFACLWPQASRPDFADEAVKTRLLGWIAERAGLDRETTSREIGRILEDLFGELAEDYGQVRIAGLDPRLFRHFLISHPES